MPKCAHNQEQDKKNISIYFLIYELSEVKVLKSSFFKYEVWMIFFFKLYMSKYDLCQVHTIDYTIMYMNLQPDFIHHIIFKMNDTKLYIIL